MAIMDIADYRIGEIPDEYYEPPTYDLAGWYNIAATDECDKELDLSRLSHQEEDFLEVQYVCIITVLIQMYDFWCKNHNNLPRSRVGRVLAFFIERSPIIDASIDFIAESKQSVLTLNAILDCLYEEPTPSFDSRLDKLGPETDFVQNGTNTQATDLLKTVYDKVNEGYIINGKFDGNLDYDYNTNQGAFYAVVNLLSQMIDVLVLSHPYSEVDGLRGKYKGYVMTEDEAKALLDIFKQLNYTDIDWSVFD